MGNLSQPLIGTLIVSRLHHQSLLPTMLGTDIGGPRYRVLGAIAPIGPGKAQKASGERQNKPTPPSKIIKKISPYPRQK